VAPPSTTEPGDDAELLVDDAKLPVAAAPIDSKRKGPKKLSHEDWMSQWADSLSLVPTELHPPETEHGSASWTVHNEATGAKVEVLFIKKGLVVKQCPVSSFLAESRRKDGGRHGAWAFKGSLEETWSWLATEIGWVSESPGTTGRASVS
jgi:hypothetical protein